MTGAHVLVTGAGGFIGGHLVAALRRRGVTSIRAVDIKPIERWYQRFDDVECLQLDLRTGDACRSACRDIEAVYQLASNMGGMGFIEANKAACMLSVLINTHMLMAARAADVKRFFFSSSACVYNEQAQRDPGQAPLREEDAYPAQPEDGYGWEKLFSERLCHHFTEDFGLETRVARLHNVYGPFGTWDGGREKAPAAICRKVVQAVASGDHRIEIWGDGTQVRTFTYIEDCIQGIERLMASDLRAPLNLGSNETVTVAGLVSLVEQIAGLRLERIYLLDAPTGVASRGSDNTKIRAELGWEPATPLRQGLRQTYAWIAAQHGARSRGAAHLE